MDNHKQTIKELSRDAVKGLLKQGGRYTDRQPVTLSFSDDIKELGLSDKKFGQLMYQNKETATILHYAKADLTEPLSSQSNHKAVNYLHQRINNARNNNVKITHPNSGVLSTITELADKDNGNPESSNILIDAVQAHMTAFRKGMRLRDSLKEKGLDIHNNDVKEILREHVTTHLLKEEVDLRKEYSLPFHAKEEELKQRHTQEAQRALPLR